jgi:hypothetical protein
MLMSIVFKCGRTVGTENKMHPLSEVCMVFLHSLFMGISEDASMCRSGMGGGSTQVHGQGNIFAFGYCLIRLYILYSFLFQICLQRAGGECFQLLVASNEMKTNQSLIDFRFYMELILVQPQIFINRLRKLVVIYI